MYNRTVSLVAFLYFGSAAAVAAAPIVGDQGGIVVANRGSGSISVIDVATSSTLHVPLPVAAGVTGAMAVASGCPTAPMHVPMSRRPCWPMQNAFS